MIKITQGDEVTLSLTCPNHNLTGATFKTRFEKEDGTYLEIGNAAHTADADQTANTGLFTVALTEANTELIKAGRSSIVTQVVQAGVTRHYHGTDILRVLQNPFLEDE